MQIAFKIIVEVPKMVQIAPAIGAEEVRGAAGAMYPRSKEPAGASRSQQEPAGANRSEQKGASRRNEQKKGAKGRTKGASISSASEQRRQENQEERGRGG